MARMGSRATCAAPVADGHPLPDRHLSPDVPVVRGHPRDLRGARRAAAALPRAIDARPRARRVARAGDADARARGRHRRWASWLAPGAARARAWRRPSSSSGIPRARRSSPLRCSCWGSRPGARAGRRTTPCSVLRRHLPLLSAVGIAGSLACTRARRSLGRVDRVVDRRAGRGADRRRGAGARARLRRAAVARARPPALAARARAVRRGRTPLAHELSDAVADRRGRCSPGSARSIRRPASRSPARIYALQVAASRWWLPRFRFGPVEWLWRALSYGRLPPLRV